MKSAVYATSPARPRAAAALERVLDSRAANDYLFSVFCQNTLMHPMAFERYYRASTERASLESSGPNLWLAYLTRDTDALKGSRQTQPPRSNRLRAIENLDTLEEIDGAVIRTSVLEVLSREPAVRPRCDVCGCSGRTVFSTTPRRIFAAGSRPTPRNTS